MSPEVMATLVERYGVSADLLPGQTARFLLRQCQATAQFFVEPGKRGEFPVELTEVDIFGIGIQADRTLPEGARLAVELQIPGLARQIWRCRVVGAAQVDGGVYNMRAIFDA